MQNAAVQNTCGSADVTVNAGIPRLHHKFRGIFNRRQCQRRGVDHVVLFDLVSSAVGSGSS